MPKLCTTCNVNLRMYGDHCRRCFFKAHPRSAPVPRPVADLPEDSPLRRLQERAERGLPLWEETQTKEQES